MVPSLFDEYLLGRLSWVSALESNGFLEVHVGL